MNNTSHTHCNNIYEWLLTHKIQKIIKATFIVKQHEFHRELSTDLTFKMRQLTNIWNFTGSWELYLYILKDRTVHEQSGKTLRIKYWSTLQKNWC